ncbi:MAG: electron transport complex subunit RsxG [Betaproteobacteria bacterium]|nr:electron transport complex subunit RsxG [Betaproteobacteria bacterium]
MNSETSVLRVSARTATVLLLFTVVFTGLMTFAYSVTRDTIAASVAQAKLMLVAEVLPAAAYDNDLLQDYVDAVAPQLGNEPTSRIYRARKGGEPAALVVEAAAPDGYSGRIALLVAVAADGTVTGVRVTEHKETPGLGDYIDIRKDRNKVRPWITQFNGIGFAQLAPTAWKVKKDGGSFDYMSGATVSARAVTNATAHTLRFVAQHRDGLFALPTGSRFAPKEVGS